MEIFYKTRIDEPHGHSTSYTATDHDSCCDDLEKLFRSSDAGFGVGGQPRLFLRFYQGNDYFVDKPLNFCPFCGAKVEAVETVRVRVVKREATRTEKYMVYSEEPLPRPNPSK